MKSKKKSIPNLLKQEIIHKKYLEIFLEIVKLCNEVFACTIPDRPRCSFFDTQSRIFVFWRSLLCAILTALLQLTNPEKWTHEKMLPQQKGKSE